MSSSNDGLHHFAMHIRETEAAALEFERQLFVMDAELVEQGGLKIMNVDAVLGDVVREVVCLAKAEAGFESAARGPDGEAARMMVPSIICRS